MPLSKVRELSRFLSLIRVSKWSYSGRIHFSVNYPRLDAKARRTIWSMFFSRAKIEIDDTELNRLASRDINGRQVSSFITMEVLSLTRQ